MISLKQLKSNFVQAMVVNGGLYKADRLFKTVLKNLYMATEAKGLTHTAMAVTNSKVFFSLRRFYKGGTSYFIPSVVVNNSEEKKAVKALLKTSKKRNQTILGTLSSELYLAAELKGDTIKLKNEFNSKVIRGIPYTRFLKKLK